MMRRMVIALTALLMLASTAWADKKISDMTENSAPATGDWVPHVDISDTTEAASGTTKKTSVTNLLGANLATIRAFSDPGQDKFIMYDSGVGFAYYTPTAYRMLIFGASGVHTELGFGTSGYVLKSAGGTSVPAFSGTIEADSIIIPHAADPNVDETGEITVDTDGANEASDVTGRCFDGSYQFATWRKLHCIQWTVYKPQDLDDAQRDLFPIWCNNTGMVFTITEIKGYADISTTIAVELVTDTNWSSPSTVDSVPITTASTGVYTGVQTSITDPTVAHDECLTIDFHDSDAPAFVKGTICGWYDADVD